MNKIKEMIMNDNERNERKDNERNERKDNE